MGDVNLDGKLDLVLTAAGSGLEVALGGGNGFFQYFNAYADTALSKLLLEDLNYDGAQDIVTISVDAVSVRLGNGDGTFGAKTDIQLSTTPSAIALSDLNNDGTLDLVAGVSNTISVRHGNGDGTFSTPTDYQVASTPTQIALSDLNGDGKLDIVSAGTELTLLVSTTTGYARTDASLPSQTRLLKLADMNGDGRQDVVSLSETGLVSISPLLADAQFGQRHDYRLGSNVAGFVITDFNEDTRPDLLVADATRQVIAQLRGNRDWRGFKAAEIDSKAESP